MTRFRFEVAEKSDDVQLDALLQQTDMPGRISLKFLRQPSFIDSNRVHGPFHQTLICRDTRSGEIVGCGCRSVREWWIDGESKPVGYLSLLRFKPQFRSLGLVSRGYKFLKELHSDGRTESYFTTIESTNSDAKKILTLRRCGLPNYHHIGKFETFVVNSRARPTKSTGRNSCQWATRSDVDSLVDFLNSRYPSDLAYPRYSRRDFSKEGTFCGLEPQNILLGFDETSHINACLAIWDQRHFRQTIVNGYSKWLQRGRLLYNVWATVRKKIRLPKPGSELKYAYVAIPFVESTIQLGAMLDLLLKRAQELGFEYILFGMPEKTSHTKQLKRLADRVYITDLYEVNWQPEKQIMKSNVMPKLELGCL